MSGTEPTPPAPAEAADQKAALLGALEAAKSKASTGLLEHVSAALTDVIDAVAAFFHHPPSVVIHPVMIVESKPPSVESEATPATASIVGAATVAVAGATEAAPAPTEGPIAR
jgi:hydroxymethylpyrimidine/phosphomethylpyrimidine kinase